MSKNVRSYLFPDVKLALVGFLVILINLVKHIAILANHSLLRLDARGEQGTRL